MDDLLRLCYIVCEVYSSDNLYRCIETHTAHSVPTLVYIPSPPVGQFSASTTVRANRETEWPLAPEGVGERWVTLVDNSEGGADLGVNTCPWSSRET